MTRVTVQGKRTPVQWPDGHSVLSRSHYESNKLATFQRGSAHGSVLGTWPIPTKAPDALILRRAVVLSNVAALVAHRCPHRDRARGISSAREADDTKPSQPRRACLARRRIDWRRVPRCDRNYAITRCPVENYSTSRRLLERRPGTFAKPPPKAGRGMPPEHAARARPDGRDDARGPECGTAAAPIQSLRDFQGAEGEPLGVVNPTIRTFDMMSYTETRDKEMSELYWHDVYNHLRNREQQLLPDPWYMRRQPHIASYMRSDLVDWLVALADEYGLHDEKLF
ncbi:hypothetical protein HPB48_014248 [Haemaphysalis longicornis]|uniref:Cyclin N-terminal domain-containing protein n=1 Tax=Haemaphysalis longicornis TaxID=44386 RepID=A0A9J6FIT3_HAELO|nr:hypothetical protein HPB48_014248 [Haemaphysalis longicornis]